MRTSERNAKIPLFVGVIALWVTALAVPASAQHDQPLSAASDSAAPAAPRTY